MKQINIPKNSEEKKIKLILDGKEYFMSFEELTQSNHILLEALISLLTKKGIIDPKELAQEIMNHQKEQSSENK